MCTSYMQITFHPYESTFFNLKGDEWKKTACTSFGPHRASGPYESLTIWQSRKTGIPSCGRSTFEHRGHATLDECRPPARPPDWTPGQPPPGSASVRGSDTHTDTHRGFYSTHIFNLGPTY